MVFTVPSSGGASAPSFESRFRLSDDFLERVCATSCGCASVAEFARDVSELPEEWGESWWAICEYGPYEEHKEIVCGWQEVESKGDWNLCESTSKLEEREKGS